MKLQDVLDFLGHLHPDIQTKIACGLLWNSLRMEKQTSLYIRNLDESRPMTICVGKDDQADKVCECVENWAKEQGLV